MTALSERAIEKAVCLHATRQDFAPYKFTSPGRRSVPDRVFFGREGSMFFIEFKRKGAKPTVLQLREHEKLKARGFRVYVCDSVDDGKLIIDFEKEQSRC